MAKKKVKKQEPKIEINPELKDKKITDILKELNKK